MKKFKLICMAPNGDHITDSESDNIEDLEKNSIDMGSKWIFYPFHFICTSKTIKEAFDGGEHFNGKRIKTIKSYFQKNEDKLVRILNQ